MCLLLYVILKLIDKVSKHEKVIRDKTSVPVNRSFEVHIHYSFQQEQREREKQDLELAKEMAEDDDDFP